jgi:hypothetical protein
MTNNARIERFKREVENYTVPPVVPRRTTLKALAKATLALAAVGALAGTLGTNDESAAKDHRFVGVTPAGSPTVDQGNVPDLTY